MKRIWANYRMRPSVFASGQSAAIPPIRSDVGDSAKRTGESGTDAVPPKRRPHQPLSQFCCLVLVNLPK